MKREALTVVALACNRVADSCFCSSMGSDPNEAPGADVLLLEADDAFEVRLNRKREKRSSIFEAVL